jgi:hypothetical protein
MNDATILLRFHSYFPRTAPCINLKVGYFPPNTEYLNNGTTRMRQCWPNGQPDPIRRPISLIVTEKIRIKLMRGLGGPEHR